MSQNHLSNNLDKIIQLISIEQVRCLMKQMKIDDNSLSESTVNEKISTSASASDNSNANETLDQLTKINNTLLLIVDKISAIETEIKMLKEVKQQKCDDDEEHIRLKIEEKEKDIISEVEILANVKEDDEEEEVEVEDSDDEIVEDDKKEEDKEVLSAVEADELVIEDKKEEDVLSTADEDDVSVEEEVLSAAEEEEVLNAAEEEVVNLEEEETDESEVEIEDDEPLSVAESLSESAVEVSEATKSAVEELEEDEEEVFEIEIDDVTYFATHEENGILYEVDKDGDVGKKVGIIKDGEPIFL